MSRGRPGSWSSSATRTRWPTSSRCRRASSCCCGRPGNGRTSTRSRSATSTRSWNSPCRDPRSAGGARSPAICEAGESPLPRPGAGGGPAELSRRIAVPLRLGRGGDEPAELWLLDDRGEEQIEALVRDADERLVQRLAFAVALE